VNTRTIRTLLWLRRTSQVFFLVLFFVLLFHARYSTETLDLAARDVTTRTPVRLFFQFDPLITLGLLVSRHLFVAGFALSLFTIAATALIGRFFCGWICPLGTLHHFFSHIRPGGKSLRRACTDRERYIRWQRLKYSILLFFLITSGFGFLQTGLLDPLCLLGRSLTLAVFPAIHFLVTRVIEAGSQLPGLSIPMGRVCDYLESHELIGKTVFYHSALVTAVVLFALLLANLFYPRFWCRFLCPLGALLGLVAPFSLVRMQRDGVRCTLCGKCLLPCQGGRVGDDRDGVTAYRRVGVPTRSNLHRGGVHRGEPLPDSDKGGGEGISKKRARRGAGECYLCLNCLAVCKEDAMGFEFLGVRDSSEYTPDLTRRGLIASAGVSLIALPFLRFSRYGGERSRLIRPPGALREEDFLATCIRCGTCTRICPTHAIHSCIAEAGLEGFWTPRLIPRIGYCVYSCTLCGQVCPSQAISRLSLEEKTGSERVRPVKLGTAVVDRGRCISWAQGLPCLACEEVCPVSPKAIKIDEEKINRLGRPVVDSLLCVGCGHCEYVCPVEGESAIRVFSAGETRSRVRS